jgi:phosphoesterase RecJ-like protein
MKNKQIQLVKEILKSKKKISIVCHRNPDGDAYGSSLALYHYLKERHQVTVISPNDCPSFLKWMPAENKIVVFEKEADRATKILEQSDIVFTLDFNALHRTGEMTEKILQKINPTYIMIDHHQQPDDYAKIKFSDTSKSSTCEMVYDFIDGLGDSDKINKEIATCIYTGIMTDTGSFRFPSTTPHTHMIVAELIKKGADNAKIYNNVMDNNSLDRMKLLSKALDNLVLLKEFKTAYITLSQRELNNFNFEKGDTEGFVNYALSIKDVVFAVIFIEDKHQGIIKMSFRSKGNFSVNEFARTHFNGGGHTNASGGRSSKPLNQTVKKFLNVLPQYKNEILNSYENTF